jgi:hypothetical protein
MKVIKLCRDKNCPSCKFPETLIVAEKKTMRKIRIECSKRCGWEKPLVGYITKQEMAD